MHVEKPEHLVELLDELVSRGSAAYRRAAEEAVNVPLDGLVVRLDDRDKELLRRHEEESNRDAGEFAADSFRLGYALGASGLLDRLVAAGLVEEP